MITSMRRCVACDDLWPWPISSRSFSLDLENRVLSVASTVLDGFFPYLVQMITSMRRCVACDDLWPWPISSRSFDLDFENRVCSVTFSVLDRLFFWLGIQYVSKVWVIMRRRGVSSERRRSSCSSFVQLSGTFYLSRTYRLVCLLHLLDFFQFVCFWPDKCVACVFVLISDAQCFCHNASKNLTWANKMLFVMQFIFSGVLVLPPFFCGYRELQTSSSF